MRSIVERLNGEGIPGSAGKRWTAHPVSRLLKNERFLGLQIWGQQSLEHEPGTGWVIKRDKPRNEWKVAERPELRIISDELWERVQKTRAEVREAVAPKRNLARGKDARFHSYHLFTGFAKCHVCGGAMSIVSGGKGVLGSDVGVPGAKAEARARIISATVKRLEVQLSQRH